VCKTLAQKNETPRKLRKPGQQKKNKTQKWIKHMLTGQWSPTATEAGRKDYSDLAATKKLEKKVCGWKRRNKKKFREEDRM